MDAAPSCLTCAGKARLVTGAEVYPHRPDLHDLHFWRCDCGSHVGCHPGTTDPLGFPADRHTRQARSMLHEQVLDPLWQNQPPRLKKRAREAVYQLLAQRMGIDRDQCHTGMFSLQQCRTAWVALVDETPASIRKRMQRHKTRGRA